MGYTVLKNHAPTKDFLIFIKTQLEKINVEASVKWKDVEYSAWDDSDQPGISEAVTIKKDGRTYQALMNHHRYKSFKEIK